jgi:hypothetical protein
MASPPSSVGWAARGTTPGGPDQSAQGVEVGGEGLPAARRQCVPGDRPAVAELLALGQVAGVAEPAQLRAQAAVGLAEERLEPAERDLVVAREEDRDPEPDAVLEQLVEPRQLLVAGQGAPARARR